MIAYRYIKFGTLQVSLFSLMLLTTHNHMPYVVYTYMYVSICNPPPVLCLGYSTASSDLPWRFSDSCFVSKTRLSSHWTGSFHLTSLSPYLSLSYAVLFCLIFPSPLLFPSLRGTVWDRQLQPAGQRLPALDPVPEPVGRWRDVTWCGWLVTWLVAGGWMTAQDTSYLLLGLTSALMSLHTYTYICTHAHAMHAGVPVIRQPAVLLLHLPRRAAALPTRA